MADHMKLIDAIQIDESESINVKVGAMEDIINNELKLTMNELINENALIDLLKSENLDSGKVSMFFDINTFLAKIDLTELKDKYNVTAMLSIKETKAKYKNEVSDYTILKCVALECGDNEHYIIPLGLTLDILKELFENKLNDLLQYLPFFFELKLDWEHCSIEFTYRKTKKLGSTNSGIEQPVLPPRVSKLLVKIVKTVCWCTFPITAIIEYFVYKFGYYKLFFKVEGVTVISLVVFLIMIFYSLSIVEEEDRKRRRLRYREGK